MYKELARKKVKARLHGADIISKQVFYSRYVIFISTSFVTLHRSLSLAIQIRDADFFIEGSSDEGGTNKLCYYLLQLVNRLDIPLTRWKYLYVNEYNKYWTGEINVWDSGVNVRINVSVSVNLWNQIDSF